MVLGERCECKQELDVLVREAVRVPRKVKGVKLEVGVPPYACMHACLEMLRIFNFVVPAHGCFDWRCRDRGAWQARPGGLVYS